MTRIFLASAPLLGVSLFALSATAEAKDIGIAPFIGNGVEGKQTALITGMVSGELDFSTEYDFAEEMAAPPAGLNAWCLDNAGCMGNITRAAGTDHLITGMVSPADAEHYNIYMVLFDAAANNFVRKKSFVSSRSSEDMADAMGGYLKELITGINPADAAAANSVASADEFDDFGEEDDFFDSPANSRTIAVPLGSSGALVDRTDPAEEARKREEAARLAAEEETRRRAAEESNRRAKAEARRRAEEEARRAAAAEAQRRAEEEDRRRSEEQKAAAVAALASQDIIFKDISAADIQVEDIDFGNALDFIAVEDAGGYEQPDSDYALADSDRYNDYEPVDLDADEPKRTREKPEREKSSRSNSSSSHGSIDGPENERFAVTAHVGYTHYKVMDFLGYGAELALQVVGGFYLKTGIEALNVRQVNDEASDPTVNLLVREWHTITPIAVGLAWSGGSGAIRPYIGGDITITPYTVAPVKVAPGVRARVGANFMVSDAFGFNLNAAGGFWYGSDWDQIEAGMSDGGLVPQISGGTVFVF